jgi:hypothetical protein
MALAADTGEIVLGINWKRMARRKKIGCSVPGLNP